LVTSRKKSRSYLGRIPSKDFFPEAYELFLKLASPEELEEDIITRKTLEKIIVELGY
jgi:hypothetical protein